MTRFLDQTSAESLASLETAKAEAASAEEPAHSLEARLCRWMVAYQAGELAAFDALYGQLQPTLRRYLIALTLDVPRAEDLLQETFLQLHRKRQTYIPPRPVTAWAFGIARFVFLMDRRDVTRRKRTFGEIPPEELVAPKVAYDLATTDLLRQQIAKLPIAQREPLLLHHVWGFTFKEISGILGIRVGAAKVRAHRAMEKLRANLGGSDATSES